MFRSTLLAVVLVFHASAQPQSVPMRRPRAETQRPVKKAEPELKQRGRQLLQSAEAEAGALTEPVLRGYAQLQLGRAYATFDRQKALELLDQAFSAVNALSDDSKAKPPLERQVLEAIASVNPQRVDELLPQVSPKGRQAALEALLAYYQKNKQNERAIELVYRIAADATFPFAAANRLMQVLPPESTTERERLFNAALASFRQEKPTPFSSAAGDGDFGEMVVRHWQTLPVASVRDAIDVILKQAESTEAGTQETTMFGQRGSLAFNSRYEWRLFQLLPVLRRIDEAAAKALLEKNKTVEAQLLRYPEGVQSWEGSRDQPAVSGVVTTTRDSAGPRAGPPSPPPEAAQMLLMVEQMNRVLRDVKDYPQDALTQALAIKDDSIRLRTLILVARATQKNNTTVCRAALDKTVDQIDRVPVQEQSNYLMDAGRLYLALGDKDGVEKVIERGVGVAEKLYKIDSNPEHPNEVAKPFWPSTTAWVSLVRLAAQVVPDAALRMVNDVQDEELRPTIRIVLATAWLSASGDPAAGTN